MKKIKSHELLEKLKSDTRQVLLSTRKLLNEDPEILSTQPAPGKWSVTQVVEHLNTYGRYYLPAIEQAIKTSKSSSDEFFRSGWLGAYFTKSMLPKEDGQVKNKMKTMKNHSPSNDYDSKVVIDEFISQQEQLLQLLDRASAVNLNQIRIPISLTKYIRLNLGDLTLIRFVNKPNLFFHFVIL